MNHNGKHWRRWILWALAGVLLLDVVLLYMNWQASGAGPRAMRQRVDELRLEHKLYGADVRRVAAIREHLPEVQRQCDRFFADELLDTRTGYSTVVGDLTSISEKSGLRATSINFKQRLLEKRGVTQVDVVTTVEGDYASLVKFINGLERSENFYLLDSLSLAASTGGTIKLNMQLRTYFRS